MIEVKKCFGKGLAGFVHKQVVSARACANQFLPYSSSGIALFGMITVQANSCLNSEQTYTLCTSAGGQEGGLGGGVVFWAGGYFPGTYCICVVW